MQSWPPDDLLPRLEVTRLGEHEFESTLESFDGRSFGGEILAKAVSAALVSCPDRSLHSLHAYFLRAVPPEQPLRFIVHGLRDGRRLSGRRVVLQREGRKVAEVLLSVAEDLAGPAFEDLPLPPDTAAPDTLPTVAEIEAAQGEARSPERPLDWRFLEFPWRQAAANDSGRWRAWIRPRTVLPDTPRIHAAALAYLSDHGSLGCIQRRFGSRFQWSASTSLDHAMWLHRPFRWTDWVFMESDSTVGRSGRALTERRIYGTDGQRIVTVAQEALVSVTG